MLRHARPPLGAQKRARSILIMAPGRATAAAWAASGAVAAAAAAPPIPAHAKGLSHTAVTSMSVCGGSRGKTSVHVGLCATGYVLVP